MIITYCRKCNHFHTSNRVSNYCKGCKAPNITVDMSYEDFTKLTINERYKLAYELTNKYDEAFERAVTERFF